MTRESVKKIGVTGGIASGKSLICKIFSHLGVPVYNADERAKWLVNNDPSLIEDIKTAFGSESYSSGNVYNRNYIATQVFNDIEKLSLLNQLIHPRVADDFETWALELHGAPYIIKEAAIMFESGSYKSLDKVVNIAASKEVRTNRILFRDPFRSREEIKAIMDKQMSEEERRKLADYTIQNDGNKLVIPQVIKLHLEFIEG